MFSSVDITNFLENHPGGIDKIMLAAGGAVEPYWNIYRQHLNNKNVDDILETLKILDVSQYVLL